MPPRHIAALVQLFAPYWPRLLLRHYAAVIMAGLGNPAGRGKTMLKLRFALVAALIAYGAYNHNHYQTVCGGTDNPALCELHLQSGDSDIEARNAGNGIFN